MAYRFNENGKGSKWYNVGFKCKDSREDAYGVDAPGAPRARVACARQWHLQRPAAGEEVEAVWNQQISG